MSSYVDDWTLRDISGLELVGQVQYVQELVKKLGIKISMQKSVMYATTPLARKRLAKCLKDANLGGSVVDSGKSLGFEFQSRASKVVNLRDKRVNELTPKMYKLRVMPWSHTKKASILLRGIYPAMLYGCELHDMGADFFRRVRSLSNGAVWKGKQYMCRYLTPLLSTPVKFEPWIWVLQRCFQAFVRVLTTSGSLLKKVWNLVIKRAPTKQPIGPVSILVSHLRKMGWTLQEDFRCITQREDSFDLSTITTWQFKWQILTAWPTCITPKLRNKVGMSDL